MSPRRIRFERPDGTSTVVVYRGAQDRDEVVNEFASYMRHALASPGCGGFGVVCHQDGTSCDHEVAS